MAADFTYKQGEADSVVLTIKDSAGTAIDVTSATLTFTVKRRDKSGSAIFTVADTSFSAKGSGTATMAVSATNTNQTITGEKEQFVGELKIVSGANTYKSEDLIFEIQRAVA